MVDGGTGREQELISKIVMLFFKGKKASDIRADPLRIRPNVLR